MEERGPKFFVTYLLIEMNTNVDLFFDGFRYLLKHIKILNDFTM